MKEAISLTVAPTVVTLISFHEPHARTLACTHARTAPIRVTPKPIHITLLTVKIRTVFHTCLSGISWNAADVVARLDVLKKTLLASGQRLTFNRPRACALSFLDPKHSFFPLLIAESV